MHRSTARRGAVVVALAAFLALMGSPAAAASWGNVPGWNALASAWAWLADLGGRPHLKGEQGSYIDPDGRHLVAAPNGSARSHGLRQLRGKLGSYIDPNGKPQNTSPSGEAGGYIDPDGK